MSKQPIITQSVREEFTDKELVILLSCFKKLKKHFPGEDLYSIDIGDRDRNGKVVWYLIDETDAYKGKIETMCLPEDD